MNNLELDKLIHIGNDMYMKGYYFYYKGWLIKIYDSTININIIQFYCVDMIGDYITEINTTDKNISIYLETHKIYKSDIPNLFYAFKAIHISETRKMKIKSILT